MLKKDVCPSRVLGSVKPAERPEQKKLGPALRGYRRPLLFARSGDAMNAIHRSRRIDEPDLDCGDPAPLWNSEAARRRKRRQVASLQIPRRLHPCAYAQGYANGGRPALARVPSVEQRRDLLLVFRGLLHANFP